jgi:hypothetical protein
MLCRPVADGLPPPRRIIDVRTTQVWEILPNCETSLGASSSNLPASTTTLSNSCWNYTRVRTRFEPRSCTSDSPAFLAGAVPVHHEQPLLRADFCVARSESANEFIRASCWHHDR